MLSCSLTLSLLGEKISENDDEVKVNCWEVEV